MCLRICETMHYAFSCMLLYIATILSSNATTHWSSQNLPMEMSALWRRGKTCACHVLSWKFCEVKVLCGWTWRSPPFAVLYGFVLMRLSKFCKALTWWCSCWWQRSPLLHCVFLLRDICIDAAENTYLSWVVISWEEDESLGLVKPLYSSVLSTAVDTIISTSNQSIYGVFFW